MQCVIYYCENTDWRYWPKDSLPTKKYIATHSIDGAGQGRRSAYFKSQEAMTQPENPGQVPRRDPGDAWKKEKPPGPAFARWCESRRGEHKRTVRAEQSPWLVNEPPGTAANSPSPLALELGEDERGSRIPSRGSEQQRASSPPIPHRLSVVPPTALTRELTL